MPTQNNYFSHTIAAFVDKNRKAQNEFLQRLCQGVQGQMIEGTPIDTGFARASWYAGPTGSEEGPGYSMVANPRYGQLSRSGAFMDWRKEIPDAAGLKAATVAISKAVFSSLKMGDKVHIINNCPYIFRLEFDGHSQQALQGFARLTVQRADQIAAAILTRMGWR